MRPPATDRAAQSAPLPAPPTLTHAWWGVHASARQSRTGRSASSPVQTFSTTSRTETRHTGASTMPATNWPNSAPSPNSAAEAATTRPPSSSGSTGSKTTSATPNARSAAANRTLGDSRKEFVEEIAWEVQYGCRTERLNSASSKPNSPNFGEKTSLPRSNTPPAAAPTLFLIAAAAPSCQPWIGTNDSPKSRFRRYLAGTRDTDSTSVSEHSRTGCQELRLQG